MQLKNAIKTCFTLILLLIVGGVSLTLRHRLECKIATEEMVSTADCEDICLLSPDQEKTRRNFTHFDIKDKQPWSTKLRKQMLVRMNNLVCIAYVTLSYKSADGDIGLSILI